MDPWVTVLIAVVTLLTALSGWLVSRVFAQNAIIDTQRETIDALKRQVDRMEMTAEITDRVLAQLPKPRSPGGNRR